MDARCIRWRLVSRRLWVGLTLIRCVAASPALAREYESAHIIQSIEDLQDLHASGELDDADFESLLALGHAPLDVNRASRDALYDLPNLTWGQVDAIIEARSTMGGLKQVDDLLWVEGLSAQAVAGVRLFVTVSVAHAMGVGQDLKGHVRTGVVHDRGLGDDLREPQHQRPTDLPEAYLAANVTGFHDFTAGIQLSLQPLVRPKWDRAQGYLVEDGGTSCNNERLGCFRERLTPVRYFVTARLGRWHVVAGTFTIGFAERLTLDTTRKEHPQGWNTDLTLYLDRSDARVRAGNDQRGVAVSLKDVAVASGKLNATAFASYNTRNLYTNNIRYHGDALVPARCATDSDCPQYYQCGFDNRCFSTRVTSSADATKSYRYHTYQDAMGELMVGGNTTWRMNERTQMGATVYHGRTNFRVPSEADPFFSPSSAYPRRNGFGALGIDGRLGMGPVDIATEVGLTFRGNPAVVGRMVYRPMAGAELTASFRVYSRDYDNPHSRATASRLMTFGRRQRNERGGRLEAVVMPISNLRMTTHIDFYDKPYQESFTTRGVQGEVQDFALTWTKDSTTYLRIRQRFQYAVTGQETLSLQLDYANNDVGQGGRDEFFSSERASDDYSVIVGRGEKYGGRISIRTTRLRGLNATVTYAAQMLDVGRTRTGFGYQHYIRGIVSLADLLWQGARVRLSAKYWLLQEAGTSDDEVNGWVSVRQSLWDRMLVVEASYGLLGKERSAGFDWGHFGGIQIESWF